MTSAATRAIDRIDAELAEIEALVDCLRRLWEQAEAAELEDLRGLGVTVSYVVIDKITVARRCVGRAY